MQLDPEIRMLVEAKRFDEVEDRWMACLESAPRALGFFMGVTSALRRAGEGERATLLLQLVADSHRERGDLEAELELLKAALRVEPQDPVLREALRDCVRRHYSARPSLERLLLHFKLAEATDTLIALEQVEAWLRFDVGTAVSLPSRGLGRVSELNLSLGTMRAEFDSGTRLSFRLAEAQKLLRPLEPGHFLLDKMEHPDAISRLAATAPGEILQRIFASLGSPLPLAEFREALAGVVPEASWNAWWKSARSDPRLAVSAGARGVLTWSASAEAADAGLSAEFETASPRDRLELARKHAARSPDLGGVLARGVAETARAARIRDPSLALEARLALDKMPHAEGADAGFEAAALLKSGDAVPVVAGVEDRGLREQAMLLLRGARADWPELYARLLRAETDSRTLALLYEALKGVPDPSPLAAVLDDVLSRPHTAPRLFLWLCREPERIAALERRDAWSLLRHLLDAQTEEAFRSLRSPLHEIFDTGGLGQQLVGRLTLEQSEQLLMVLEREIGLEEHRKADMRSSVWAHFPELREMGEEMLYSTPEAIDRKKAEFEHIVKVDIPHNAEQIRIAAAHGDLRENFEYKAARDKHEMLSSHAKRLHDDLRRARGLDPTGIDASAVRVGTRVTLEPAGNGAERRILVLLGPWDSDPATGILSYLAPAVQPLLGKRRGERVHFGDIDYVVGSIEVWR